MAKTLNVFETFSGIGAQHKALTNIFNNEEVVKKYNLQNKNFKMVGTSEWYINGIIAYDAIHHGSIDKYPKHEELTKEEMLKFLEGYDLSKDSKNLYEFDKIKKLPEDKIKTLYIAIKRNKNFGSIIDIKGKDLPKIDLLTYSFPCQDISAAGKSMGFSKENQECEDTCTRSGLLWEIERILFELKALNKLPRFLVMENVKALLQKRHIEDWKAFAKTLEEMGYMNTTMVLNAKDFGIPQGRERVFVVSELNGITNINVDKPGLSSQTVGEFFDFDNPEYKEEQIACIPNDTPTRRKTWEENKQIFHDSDSLATLTTKVDRNPNCGCIYYPNNEFQTTKTGNQIAKSKFRYITPREGIRMMGFDNEDYESIHKAGINTKDEFYKLAGNSIVVQVLEGIFTSILKKF